jgi:hypothetical protein
MKRDSPGGRGRGRGGRGEGGGDNTIKGEQDEWMTLVRVLFPQEVVLCNPDYGARRPL